MDKKIWNSKICSENLNPEYLQKKRFGSTFYPHFSLSKVIFVFLRGNYVISNNRLGICQNWYGAERNCLV